jgi:NAD(P)-dependent dehydrogenase (short-subunit alcohol dehydrogenase family)
MTELAGRIALVTGASRGIGEATARALAAAGAKVAVTDLAAPEALAAQIGGLARAQDVTSETGWDTTIDWLRTEFGGLDLLVNNAGRFLMKPITETTLDEWRGLQAVNVDAIFLGTRAAIPLLAERASKWVGGTAIVNLSSIAGLIGSANIVCYNATKGAVRLLTKGAAMELAPKGIRVSSVHPGVIETAMGDDLIQRAATLSNIGEKEMRAAMTQMTPLGRMGLPGHVADTIVFLASDRAAFMTGSELVVDGGATAGS